MRRIIILSLAAVFALPFTGCTEREYGEGELMEQPGEVGEIREEEGHGEGGIVGEEGHGEGGIVGEEGLGEGEISE